MVMLQRRRCWRARSVGLWAAVVASALLSACAPQQLLLRGVANQLAGQGAATEDDLVLAREASAFYLKLSESVLRETPGHLPLAEAVAGGFTRYAYAFVALDADRLETQDAKAAQRLRERAARLYLRAQRHALTAMEEQHPGFASALAQPQSTLQLKPELVGVAYWAAAAWGGHIALSKDKPDTVADLPQVLRLARMAWAVAPQHGEGDLASLMGTLETARPGGTSAQAQAYFDQAVAASGGRSAGPFVAQAEALAQPAGDRAAFEALLRQALQAAAQHRTLANEVMRERAQWLLDTADDRF